MSFLIELLDGTSVDLEKFGMIPISLDIDSPAPRHASEIVEGKGGYYDMGTALEGRTIRASFLVQVVDDHDFSLLRDELFKLFDARTFFYLIEKEEPQKRWKVKTAAVFTPLRAAVEYGRVEISFTSPSPYSESRGTTLGPLTFTAEKWQVGQGLTLEEPKYVHNTSSFQIFNAGDIAIDPRELPLKITYRGASDNLKIKNITTGDEWHHKKTSATNDNIVLDGIRSTKNSLSIFSDTNHKLITLAPGWNTFQLSGTIGNFLITFDHRFYYI